MELYVSYRLFSSYKIKINEYIDVQTIHLINSTRKRKRIITKID